MTAHRIVHFFIILFNRYSFFRKNTQLYINILTFYVSQSSVATKQEGCETWEKQAGLYTHVLVSSKLTEVDIVEAENKTASNPQPKILCPYKCPIAVNDMHYRPEPLNKLTGCCWRFTTSPFPKSFWRRQRVREGVFAIRNRRKAICRPLRCLCRWSGCSSVHPCSIRPRPRRPC